MYRDISIVGVAITTNTLTLAAALNDYSHINARSGSGNSQLARCLTGLGPSGNDVNHVLGGWYFNGNVIANRGQCNEIITSVPGGVVAGVINIRQCGTFSTAAEGVYTCTMMNSSMMYQSVRLGIYFNDRSESLDLYIPSLNYLSFLYTATPVIDTPPSSTVTVNVGTSLTLNCTSRGSPPDTFTWRKDNNSTVLQSTSITAMDYTITSAVFRANYSIDNITTSNNGTYTCTITNPIGVNSTTITVVVIGKLI